MARSCRGGETHTPPCGHRAQRAAAHSREVDDEVDHHVEERVVADGVVGQRSPRRSRAEAEERVAADERVGHEWAGVEGLG